VGREAGPVSLDRGGLRRLEATALRTSGESGEDGHSAKLGVDSLWRGAFGHELHTRCAAARAGKGKLRALNAPLTRQALPPGGGVPDCSYVRASLIRHCCYLPRGVYSIVIVQR
jgi:hypothetical protein